MDKGAHYHRCDFQVHTPRDNGWIGQDATSDVERKEYAKDFIKACRDKSLKAVAITDHHDLTFFKYIKEAANEELGINNIPIPPEEKIIVFPGMELTLNIPCQAIIIFDAEYPIDFFPNVYPVLLINPNGREVNRHPQPTRLAFSSFSQLYEELTKRDFLKNRFIILPNVSEGGSSTILRKGFTGPYKEMPCVGGYLDGGIDQLGSGNTSILNGKDQSYGPKKLGLFQTSDNRRRDFQQLGEYTTWVKWAVPTAEAIRQACLAKESRISQDVPLLPAIYLTSIDITNSKFLGQANLDFNQQYNAIIGGRGTGKSTILEYLRWGLCDQIPDYMNGEEELPKYQDKRKNLIEKTLLPLDATVQVSFVKNSIPHIVRRKSSTGEVLLKIGEGEFQPCSSDDIRNLLPIQAYSQKQLSSVGVSLEELKRLINSPVRHALGEFDLKFKSLKSEIRNCYELRQRKRLLEKEIDHNELELKSLTEQVDELRKGLKGLTDEDKKTISVHRQYETLEQIIEGWLQEIKYARSAVESLENDTSEYPAIIPSEIGLPETESQMISLLHGQLAALFTSVRADVQLLKAKLDEKGIAFNEISQIVNKLGGLLSQHKARYEAAKQKSTSQETTLQQIQKTEDRVKEIRKSLSEKRQGISKTGNPEDQFNALKVSWFNAHKEKADVLGEQCEKLSGYSDNNLKATLKRGCETSQVEEALKKLASGSSIRKEKIEDLCKRITMAVDPIHEWSMVLSELETLSLFGMEKNSTLTLPNTSIINSVGFTTNDVRKLAEKLTSENWINLFLVQLGDLPIFQYRAREGDYIDFSDASAGQQATALIRVLLNQEGPPLVIDQPEDDLDNQMVSQIAELIWEAKRKRQLIFSSHNANIVVNGDAELVVCCDYKVSGDQSKGGIKKEGAIDIEDIRVEITKVMEGGEDAFKLRKEKYGF